MSRFTIALPAATDSPGRARDQVHEACSEWGIEHVSDVARLVVSELVTNAVSHAGSDIEVDLSLRGPFLHVRVRDNSPAEPQLRREKETTLGGRGLRLVDLYANAWGYIRGCGGKVVWATLRAQPAAA